MAHELDRMYVSVARTRRRGVGVVIVIATLLLVAIGLAAFVIVWAAPALR